MSVYRTVELVVSKIYVQQNSSQSNNSGIKKNLLISGGFRGAHAGFSFGISVFNFHLYFCFYGFRGKKNARYINYSSFPGGTPDVNFGFVVF